MRGDLHIGSERSEQAISHKTNALAPIEGSVTAMISSEWKLKCDATRHVVLVGMGHAHVEVLRAFSQHRHQNICLTVITREAASPYSGMLPGTVAGHYTRADAEIAVAPLARSAGAAFVLDEVVALDPQNRQVHRAAGAPIAYDLISIDIGSRPHSLGIEGVSKHAIPVKPIDRFLARFESLRADVIAGRVRRIVLVGGGAGGVELVLAVSHRLRGELQGRALEITLVSASNRILPGFPDAFRARVEACVLSAGINLISGARVVAVTANEVRFEDGGMIEADAVLWTTQASPAKFLSASGLACDANGFLLVDEMLRAVGQDSIFAAGDMIAFGPRPIPKSGVYAVRAGPVLAYNLRAQLDHRALTPFRPQRHALAILATGGKHAVATWYGITVSGKWVWRWKDSIDRRFMARFRPTD